MTYEAMISRMDNLNYRGKMNRPMKRVNYTADIEIKTTEQEATLKIFGADKLTLMRRTNVAILNFVNYKMNRYVDDDDEDATEEVLSITITETDRDGKVTVIEQ